MKYANQYICVPTLISYLPNSKRVNHYIISKWAVKIALRLSIHNKTNCTITEKVTSRDVQLVREDGGQRLPTKKRENSDRSTRRNPTEFLSPLNQLDTVRF